MKSAFHILAIAFPESQGHFNPLKNLCLELAGHGFKITFLTVEILPKRVSNITSDQSDGVLQYETIPLQMPEISSTSLVDIVSTFFNSLESLEVTFEEFVRNLSTRPCCIISDFMLQFTQHVAKRMGIPRASLSTPAAVSLIVDSNVTLLLSKGDIPVKDSNKEKIIDYIIGLKPLQSADIPFIYHENDAMTVTDPGYKRKLKRSNTLVDDAWVLVNSSQDVEPQAFEALKSQLGSKCIGVGPLIDRKASKQQLSVECLEWLNMQPKKSVVYISCGSYLKLSKEDFAKVAEGLKASNLSFLWVIKTATFGGRGAREEEMRSIKQELIANGKGMIVDWTAQVEVLTHEATGAFLTHCGWNSVLESICAGVPMLCLPMLAEQNLNAKLIVDDMKIGMRLHRNGKLITGDEIGHVMKEVMENDEMKLRTENMKDSALKSIEEGGSSHLNLIAFMDDIRSRSM